MAYGTVKVDNIVFNNGGIDETILVSGIYSSLTDSLTVTGTVSGQAVHAVSGVFTSISGTVGTINTLSGQVVNATSGVFTSISGTTGTINTLSGQVINATSGVFSDITATTVTASLSGNASTADALSSNRSFALTGDVTGSVSSDLSSGASITTTIASGVIINNDVSASAAIQGTKISPNFGAQNIITTGSITGASLIPSGASVPANGLYLPAANTVGIATNASERLRITSSGILTVGTSGEATTYDTYTRLLQVHGIGNEGLHLGNWGNGTGGGDLIFTKSKSGTIGTYALCVDGDILGDIEFAGSNGTSGFNAAARIRTTAAGNHTSSVAGGVLSFYTTHNASGSTLKERMALSNNGQLRLGTPTVASTQDLLYLNNRDATDLPIASNYSLIRSLLYTQEAMAPYDVWGVNLVTAYTDGASPYTINNLIAYRAFVNDTSGSNVTLTNTYGFVATAQLGLYATNGYGFYSQIATGANKWNFYAQGTAASYFEGEVRTNTALCYKTTVTAVNISFTIAASTLKGGIRTSTPTADITAQVPTGTNMDSAFTSLATDHSIEWTYINLAAATYKVTITSNTGHTLVGDMVVPAATSARFLSRKTAANTFVTYRIA